MPTVFVLGSDGVGYDEMTRLLEANGFRVRTLASAEELLEICSRQASGCAVLDVCLPDRNEPALQARYEGLTRRERQVMALVATGTSNKETARQLKISHRTVETHRARVMRKMGAISLLQLVKMAESVRPRA